MTCEEFRTVPGGRKILSQPRAVLAAMDKHYRLCEACQKYVKGLNKRLATEEDVRLVNETWSRVLADPEARKVIED